MRNGPRFGAQLRHVEVAGAPGMESPPRWAARAQTRARDGRSMRTTGRCVTARARYRRRNHRTPPTGEQPMSHPHQGCQIIPDDVLKKIEENAPTIEQRNAARRSLAISQNLRAKREAAVEPQQGEQREVY